MSSRQLNRILALNDLTVKKLIMDERLSRVRRLIEADGMDHASVGELAYQFGFSSPSQLSRAFRKHYGVGPTEAHN
jgi:AraC-like DNA-binding protein